MKSARTITLLSVLAIMLIAAPSAFAVVLSVGSNSGNPGDTLQIPITVDVATAIAGASFTIIYDSDNLTLTTIESSFFDTFANQWATIVPPPNPYPPDSVDVGDPPQTYTQPLVQKDITEGTMLAAARYQAGESNTTLFTLTFAISSDALAGDYPVNIIQSNINNTDAGYDAGGEDIPYLVGADDDEADLTLAFPVISATVVSGTLTVQEADADADGLPDDFEQQIIDNDPNDGIETIWHVLPGDDYDQDGYSNLEEMINGTDPTDPNDPGCGDLVADFGSDGFGADGIWKYDGTSWEKIANSDPDGFVVWDCNLVADFGSDSIGADGIWEYDGTSWNKIANSDPESFVDWCGDLVADFGSDSIGADGIWKYDGTSSWEKIAYSDPEGLAVWDCNLVADFGSDGIGADGIWKYDGSSSWEKVANSDPEDLAVWDGNLVADFGSDGIGADGVWKYDGTSWVQIGDFDPEGLVDLCGVLIADRGADGIWKYDGTSSWEKVANSDPEGLAVWCCDLVADFGSDGIGADGIWKYDGTSWVKIANSDPEGLVAW